jgi:ferredoxin
MRVKADYDLCEANGLCEAMAPDTFQLDDDDNLNLLDDQVTAENEGRIRQAVAACPKAALTIED